MGLFEEMQDIGLKPNVYTYTTLFAALAKGGQVAKSQELFQSMKVCYGPRAPVPLCRRGCPQQTCH